jgi:hypothetical protein
MPTAVHLVELAGLCLALVAGGVSAVLIVRSSREAARKTTPDALSIVLNPAAVAEEAEWEFTTMLRRGELTQSQYRTLLASLAEDSSPVRRPAARAETDHRRVS